ncbi:hypothetical protein F3Y22_tig00111837pilonHSYRG00890 [Hibiscus syriacus]|uniref:Uncharacterized protein n=1 Tax=Hibiscus syriacus TaxID=106335 RepID=A0A6A2YEF7_HIBSY|nr:hypothetical protein F3Y22_tig00111837pilonHSYRG00890 [Hibiscus syriacus]
MKISGVQPYTVELEQARRYSHMAIPSRCFDEEVLGLYPIFSSSCIVVGFSYGGMVAFKMAELYPHMVEAMVGLKALLSVAAHKKLWFPDRLHKDYLEVMLPTGRELNCWRAVISKRMPQSPSFPQVVSISIFLTHGSFLQLKLLNHFPYRREYICYGVKKTKSSSKSSLTQ